MGSIMAQDSGIICNLHRYIEIYIYRIDKERRRRKIDIEDLPISVWQLAPEYPVTQ
jgi:hypothetical protein